MRVFVTGTDTNIGKTFISARLCQLWKADYWKPIQTGQPADHTFMPEGVRIHPEAYHLQAPLSPHAAAAREGVGIDLQSIQCPNASSLVVEGAGGVFVPLNEKEMMIDLIKHLNLPILVVAPNRLGVINQVLLTLHALKGLEILGVILNGEDSTNIHEEAIKKFSGVSVYNENSLCDI